MPSSILDYFINSPTRGGLVEPFEFEITVDVTEREFEYLHDAAINNRIMDIDEKHYIVTAMLINSTFVNQTATFTIREVVQPR